MRILLIRRGAIGDILMSTPLIRQLKMHSHNILIDYCLSKSCAVALKNNPYISNLIILDDKIFSAKGIISFIKFVVKIRHNYDYVFILGKNWLINLLFKLSCAKVIGFARENISRYLLNYYVIYDNLERYQVCYYLDLLKVSAIGKPNYDDLKMDIILSDTDKIIVNNMVQLFSIDQYIIVTNSGGNNNFEDSGLRMLPEDKILELLNRLIKLPHKIILLGGKLDHGNYNKYINKLPSKNNIINFAGELSLAQSCYLLSKASHFYVTDCGAMHLGIIAGLESNMTCFFGPTNPAHILPSGAKCNVIWNDKDIFDDGYQLYGKIKNDNIRYFQKLNIKQIPLPIFKYI